MSVEFASKSLDADPSLMFCKVCLFGTSKCIETGFWTLVIFKDGLTVLGVTVFGVGVLDPLDDDTPTITININSCAF